MIIGNNSVVLIDKYTYPEGEMAVFFTREDGEVMAFAFTDTDNIHPVSRDVRDGQFFPPPYVRKETLNL